jgi:AraC family transcriptional regulator
VAKSLEESGHRAHSRRRGNSTGDTTTYRCLSSGSFLGKVVRRHACAGLSLSETCHPAGASLPRHYHKHAYFCLVRRGTYREEYGKQRRICSPRMVAFHPPEEIHAQHVDREEVWSFNVEITLAWTRRFVDYELPLNRPFDCTAGPAVGLALRLLDEFENFDASSPLVVDGLTLELLGVCDRQSREESAIPRWLRRVSEILNERCTAPWNLADLAAEAGVHPVYLAGTFRRHFGCTVGQYVRGQRIQLACRQLTNTRQTLTEIAARSGFSDQSHFNRVFKRHVGLTPATYRRLSGQKRSKS